MTVHRYSNADELLLFCDKIYYINRINIELKTT